MTAPIVVLAGGASSRMGSRNKLLEPVQGQPLVRVQAMRALQASPDVSVVIRPHQPEVEQALADLPLQVLIAEEALEGMGGSIRAATKAHLDAACFLLVLADLIDIEPADMHAVIRARRGQDGAVIWRGATEDGKPGHPILFDQAVFPDLLRLKGDDGARDLVARQGDKVRLVPLEGQKARRDLDTPEQWDAWRRHIERSNASD